MGKQITLVVNVDLPSGKMTLAKGEPVLPILYKRIVGNLGSDCDTQITVDSEGTLFSHTVSWCNAPSTFEREIADRQAMSAQLYKDIEALRAIQRKVNERFRNG